jgi:FtsZ-binding cell division protein ZapB
LAVEFLDELERKVDLLIKAHAELRRENAALKEDAAKNAGSVSETEKENRALKKEIAACRADLQSKEERLKGAAVRIQNLIEKISAV